MSQAEWESCKSSRRMLLALQDSGKDTGPIVKKLRWIAVRHKKETWHEALSRVEKGACLCAFRVALIVEAVFGGELGIRITTSVIRVKFPQEPEKFEEIGNLAGRPNTQNYLGVVVEPHKIVFGRDRTPYVD